MAKKQPFAASDPNTFYQSHPAWRVGKMEMVDPFGWHNMDGRKLSELRQKLGNFESMTWAEILIKAKKQHHAIPKKDLCKPARDRLIAIQEDDVDDLVRLRLSNLERVWGILDGDVFRVLWWDPYHLICPSRNC